MSASPDDTALKDSNGATSSPALNTFTCSLPPDSAPIDLATRSALDCSPGNVFGQVVTILSSRTPCAMAGDGNAGDAATTLAPAMKRRRFIVFLLVDMDRRYRLGRTEPRGRCA